MSTAAAENQNAIPAAADERDIALPLRGDTFLGVFEAIGEDLGFHANWLRIPFAALLLWNPVAIVASYLGLGCAVAASRWLFPMSKRQADNIVREAGATGGIVENRDSEELLAA